MPSDKIGYTEMEHIVRGALSRAGMNEPRHYAMVRAIVAGMLMYYPAWLGADGAVLDDEIMKKATSKLDYIVRAIATLDEATPLSAKINPAMN